MSTNTDQLTTDGGQLVGSLTAGGSGIESLTAGSGTWAFPTQSFMLTLPDGSSVDVNSWIADTMKILKEKAHINVAKDQENRICELEEAVGKLIRAKDQENRICELEEAIGKLIRANEELVKEKLRIEHENIQQAVTSFQPSRSNSGLLGSIKESRDPSQRTEAQ